MDGDDPKDLSTEALTVAFAAALLGRPEAGGCPPAAEVWDALHGAPPAGRRAAVIDHVGGCPMCAESWRLAARGAPVGEDPW
jgi:hypothetical protein